MALTSSFVYMENTSAFIRHQNVMEISCPDLRRQCLTASHHPSLAVMPCLSVNSYRNLCKVVLVLFPRRIAFRRRCERILAPCVFAHLSASLGPASSSTGSVVLQVDDDFLFTIALSLPCVSFSLQVLFVTISQSSATIYTLTYQTQDP